MAHAWPAVLIVLGSQHIWLFVDYAIFALALGNGFTWLEATGYFGRWLAAGTVVYGRNGPRPRVAVPLPEVRNCGLELASPQ